MDGSNYNGIIATNNEEYAIITDSNYTNNSYIEIQKIFTTYKLYDILIPLFGALTITLNLAVVISSGLIIKKGQKPIATYLFLGNVAMADLITAITVVIGHAFPDDLRDHYICCMQIGMVVASTIALIYSLGLIAVDRYLYIVYGMQYQLWVTPLRARLCIAITWILGCVMGFMPLFGWYNNTDYRKKCWFTLLAPQAVILTATVLCIIPLIAIILLYSIILYHAIKTNNSLLSSNLTISQNNSEINLRIFRGNSITTENHHHRPVKRNILKKIFTTKIHSPNKWKAIKIVCFTTGSFLITWMPFLITILVNMWNKSINFDSELSPLHKISPLGFFNLIINPVIYAWWHNGFRNFIKSNIKCCGREEIIMLPT